MNSDLPSLGHPVLRRYGHVLFFTAIVAGVYGTALTLAHRLPRMEGSGALALGLTLDMVALIPVAYFFLIVRRFNIPVATLVPVLILSVLAAAWILPSTHQGPLRILEFIVGFLEIGLISWIGWKAIRALRHAGGDRSADPLEQFRRAAMELLDNERLAGMFATELAVFYYSLASWRARPHVPAGATSFSHHRRSGQAAIVFALLLLMLVEGIAVHVLLSLWTPIAAWIFTAGTIYGALWLVADYRATVLRPFLIDDRQVHLRAGLRWTIRISPDEILEVAPQNPGTGKDSLNLTFLGSPTHWLINKNPVSAQGAYGFNRGAGVIGIRPDSPEEFENKLAALTH